MLLDSRKITDTKGYYYLGILFFSLIHPFTFIFGLLFAEGIPHVIVKLFTGSHTYSPPFPLFLLLVLFLSVVSWMVLQWPRYIRWKKEKDPILPVKDLLIIIFKAQLFYLPFGYYFFSFFINYATTQLSGGDLSGFGAIGFLIIPFMFFGPLIAIFSNITFVNLRKKYLQKRISQEISTLSK